MASKLKKGDKVKIMLGKDRGKEGVVERLLAKEGKIYVTGVNVYKRSLKASAFKSQDGKGQVIDVIQPINISNAELICPNCGKSTRVGFEIGKNGKVRVCRKCKKQI